MAFAFLPDPLQLLRRLVNTLEGRVNALANEKMNSAGVARAMSALFEASLVAQQVLEGVSGRVLKRLNLPSHSQIGELLSTLHRMEAKLDQLSASQSHPVVAAAALERPRPARTRRAPQPQEAAKTAEAPVSTTAKPRKAKRR